MAESNSTISDLSNAGLNPNEIKLILRLRGMTEAKRELFMSLIKRKAFQTHEEIFEFLDFAENRNLPINEALSYFPNVGGAS